MYIYKIHNFLNVKTNLKEILPPVFRSNNDEKPCQLEILFINNFKHKLSIEKLTEIAPGMYIDYPKQLVISKFSLGGKNIEARLHFSTGKTTFQFNSLYYYLSKYILKIPMSSFYPIEHLIKLIIQTILLKKGYSFIISAGLIIKNTPILLTSFGGIGKTLTTINLMKNNSSSIFFSDDTLITDGTKIYSYPSIIRVRKLGNPILSIEQFINPQDVLNINLKSNITMKPKILFFLEKGSKNRIYKITSTQAKLRYKSICNKILNVKAERMHLTANYLGSLNIEELEKRQNIIINSLLKRTQCIVIEVGHPKYYSQLIEDYLNTK